MSTRIYHNPRCTKSRQTLQLLQDHHIQPTVIEYLKTPPGVTELADLLALLGMRPRELMRRKEAEYQSSGASDPTLTDDALIRLMVANPKLIERPIVVKDGKAALGRPPENVLEIL